MKFFKFLKRKKQTAILMPRDERGTCWNCEFGLVKTDFQDKVPMVKCGITAQIRHDSSYEKDGDGMTCGDWRRTTDEVIRTPINAEDE